jgi:predicted house-cleaning NTP pyrophosphatase (Maf/HAM1 superfamily)
MTTTTRRIVLGSSSRFRRSLLSSWGVEFTYVSPDIDEDNVLVEDADSKLENRPQSAPEKLCMAIAQKKADAVLQNPQCKPANAHEQVLVITSDQVSSFNGTIREKPRSRDVRDL